MAQAGLWVPAQKMRLRPADAIYTRMGAHDSILQGRSTFLEELRDASALLAAATPSSLVIVDELGRGTATHDGVAIAAATLEHLALRTKCCTLFSTHYPEVRASAARPHHCAGCFCSVARAVLLPPVCMPVYSQWAGKSSGWLRQDRELGLMADNSSDRMHVCRCARLQSSCPMQTAFTWPMKPLHIGSCSLGHRHQKAMHHCKMLRTTPPTRTPPL